MFNVFFLRGIRRIIKITGVILAYLSIPFLFILLIYHRDSIYIFISSMFSKGIEYLPEHYHSYQGPYVPILSEIIIIIELLIILPSLITFSIGIISTIVYIFPSSFYL